jgi:hypothetical protein
MIAVHSHTAAIQLTQAEPVGFLGIVAWAVASSTRILFLVTSTLGFIC